MNSMNSDTKKPAKIRRSIRGKLSKHQKIHDTAIFAHNVYCSLTGSLHSLPDFYIIGAAKCGTTSLYQYLIRHPSVNPGIGKELHYFEELYYRGENWYRACFPFQFQKFFSKLTHDEIMISGDSTPRYIDHPLVPNRINKLTPNAKFIVMLRNPIDRAFSHYNMNIKHKYEKLSFEDAIKNEPDRIKSELDEMKKTGKVSYKYYLYAYLDRGIYVKRLKQWMEIFPKENFFIIQSEDFFKDPSVYYNKTLEFLNLSKYELDKYGTHMEGRYNDTQIESKTREKLESFFKPHNDELNSFLKRDFHW